MRVVDFGVLSSETREKHGDNEEGSDEPPNWLTRTRSEKLFKALALLLLTISITVTTGEWFNGNQWLQKYLLPMHTPFTAASITLYTATYLLLHRWNLERYREPLLKEYLIAAPVHISFLYGATTLLLQQNLTQPISASATQTSIYLVALYLTYTWTKTDPVEPEQVQNGNLDILHLNDVDARAAADFFVGDYFSSAADMDRTQIVVSYPDEDLAKIPKVLKQRRREPWLKPVLIAVTGDMDKSLKELKNHFDAIILANDRRTSIRNLLEVFANTPPERLEELEGVGSGTVFGIKLDKSKIRNPDTPGALKQAISDDLSSKKGLPIHVEAQKRRESSETPVKTIVTTPRSYAELPRQHLPEPGPQVLKSDDEAWVTVLRLYLSDEFVTEPQNNDEEENDRFLDKLPNPVDGDKRAGPLHTVFHRSVLQEIASHALSQPGTEIYGMLYEDEQGHVVKYHPIDSEDHVERTEDTVKHNPGFLKYIKRLSRLYEEQGYRLNGTVHSHPNAPPIPSQVDREGMEHVWRNEHNDYVIVGLSRGKGPDKWVSVGNEFRREVNGKLVKVKSYAPPDGKEKKLEAID